MVDRKTTRMSEDNLHGVVLVLVALSRGLAECSEESLMAALDDAASRLDAEKIRAPGRDLSLGYDLIDGLGHLDWSGLGNPGPRPH